MPIQDTDLIVVHRAGTDYKATVADLNIEAAKDGKLTIKDSDGNSVGEFTANQEGDTEVTLPEGFSGSYNDLADKPDINDGKLTVKDSNDNVLGEFTANQDGDTEIVLPAGGSDGGGLDCAGVADCLVNAPVDTPKYAFSALIEGTETPGYFHEDGPPIDWPEDLSIAHMYFELCDPDDHHLLKLGEEGHGYSGGDRSIFRLPAAYVWRQRIKLAICAPPPVYVDDREVIYGFHPDILHVEDLKIYSGKYEEGVTTTEQLWTEGDPVNNVRMADGHIALKRKVCDNVYEFPHVNFTCEAELDGYGETFFRLEFTCHKGDVYHYVFIVHNYYIMKSAGGKPTTLLNPEIENIQIKPMEDN